MPCNVQFGANVLDVRYDERQSGYVKPADAGYSLFIACSLLFVHSWQKNTSITN